MGEDQFGSLACGDGRGGRLVHLAGGDGAVVEEDEARGELSGIRRTSVGGEVEEQAVYPDLVGRGGLGFDAVRGCFGGGVDEGASAVVGLFEQLAEYVVDGQDPLAGVGVRGNSGGDAIGPHAVSVGEVFGDR